MSLAWRRRHPERAAESARRGAEKYRRSHLAKVAEGQRHYRQNNLDKVRARDRAYYAKNKTRIKQNWIKVKYGVTKEEFEATLHRQGNTCAICLRPFDTVPHIDHDHATGRFRGLTCSFCNRALGMLRDDPASFRRAAEYLEGVRTLT